MLLLGALWYSIGNRTGDIVGERDTLSPIQQYVYLLQMESQGVGGTLENGHATDWTTLFLSCFYAS